MLLLDANVVIAYHRDDHPDHDGVESWFSQMLMGDEPFAVPVSVWASFLRITTNRRIFTIPTPTGDAFAFIDAVRAQPLYLAIDPGPRHLALLRELCDEADASGDLIPDAVLAATATEYGCEVVTLDRDFARFEKVKHRRPLIG